MDASAGTTSAISKLFLAAGVGTSSKRSHTTKDSSGNQNSESTLSAKIAKLSRTNSKRTGFGKDVNSRIVEGKSKDFMWDLEENPAKEFGHECEFEADRNFPCQTLKIRNVSLVVMGS
jgi:hypothetical protein